MARVDTKPGIFYVGSNKTGISFTDKVIAAGQHKTGKLYGRKLLGCNVRLLQHKPNSGLAAGQPAPPEFEMSACPQPGRAGVGPAYDDAAC